MKLRKSLLALVLALVLVVSLAACAGTGSGATNPATTPSTVPTTAPTGATTGPTESNPIPADGSTLGEGAHSFTFEVVMVDGASYHYTVNTDQALLGKALLDLGLIEGDESTYGLYVTAVLGTSLDYNTDGYWWSLYENGEASSLGVDNVTIVDGSTYAFRAEKA